MESRGVFWAVAHMGFYHRLSAAAAFVQKTLLLCNTLGMKSPCQWMIGVSNHRNETQVVFRFHDTILIKWARIPRDIASVSKF